MRTYRERCAQGEKLGLGGGRAQCVSSQDEGLGRTSDFGLRKQSFSRGLGVKRRVKRWEGELRSLECAVDDSRRLGDGVGQDTKRGGRRHAELVWDLFVA